jgi:hypothetical protein
MAENEAFEVIRVDGETTAMNVLQAALEKAFENKAVPDQQDASAARVVLRGRGEA